MSSRYSSAAHQRDLRTQLFGTAEGPPKLALPPVRSESPYDRPAQQKYNESYLLTLELQNEDDLGSMSAKVRALKDLSVRMGGEINKGMKLNDEITNSMQRGQITLKRTWNSMIVMSQRAGISWKAWLAVFGLVALWRFWVWLF